MIICVQICFPFSFAVPNTIHASHLLAVSRSIALVPGEHIFKFLLYSFLTKRLTAACSPQSLRFQASTDLLDFLSFVGAVEVQGYQLHWYQNAVINFSLSFCYLFSLWFLFLIDSC